MKETEAVQAPEEGFRRIDIVIRDEQGDSVFAISGNVPRKTSHKFIEGIGYAFIPQEEPVFARPSAIVSPLGKISCEHTRDCTDYPKDCSKCGNNKARSYFKPKED